MKKEQTNLANMIVKGVKKAIYHEVCYQIYQETKMKKMIDEEIRHYINQRDK